VTKLKIDVTPLFEQSYTSTDRTVVEQGGTSSGKTWRTLQVLFTIAYKDPGCLISVVSESLPHLKRGAMRDFINLLLMYEVYNEKMHNKTDNSFMLGKSKVEFFGADQPDKLRGARRDYLFINECNNVTKAAYDQLEVRTRNRVWLDFNPVSEFWVHESVLPTEGVTFIKSTYKDNPFLDKQIIRAIERRRETDPAWFKVFGMGEVGSIEGLVYSNWDMVDAFPAEKDCKFYVYGMDFGYTNDPSALIKVALHQGDIYLEEMLYETGLTNNDLVDRLKALNVDRNSEIFADSAEPKSIETIKRNSFFIKPARKGKDSILNGIDIVKRYQLKVTKGSVNLIKELRNYKWVEKGDKVINKPVDHHNHLLDAMRYAISMKCKEKTGILAIGINR